MKITVRVKAGTSDNKIEKTTLAAGSRQLDFIVSVKARAIDGRANEAVQNLVADHFNIPQSQAVIVSGFKSKIKIIDLGDIKQKM